MTIYAIVGGIGTGKTLSLTAFGLVDLEKGKKLFCNIKLKNVQGYKKLIFELNKDIINNMFLEVKNGTLKLENSTILIQEAHNYLDSRNSMSKQNKSLSYWILQSRHTGKGSCDIIYDTQNLGQVDIRLRRNTDFIMRPTIIKTSGSGIPKIIRLEIEGMIGHKSRKFIKILSVEKAVRCYDTHEIVDF